MYIVHIANNWDNNMDRGMFVNLVDNTEAVLKCYNDCITVEEMLWVKV